MGKQAVYEKVEKFVEALQGDETAAYAKLHAFLDQEIEAAKPAQAEGAQVQQESAGETGVGGETGAAAETASEEVATDTAVQEASSES